MKPTPPKKQPGQQTGPRTINGLLLDVRSGAALLGVSEKQARGLIARRLLPFKRLGGRIVLSRRELEAFVESLDGCDLAEAQENRERRHG
jgi:hypothetical protein